MSWSPKALRPPLIPFLCLVLLYGCGYAPAGSNSSILGNGQSTLRLSGIEQPTLMPWVNYSLRSALRDEFRGRNLAVWVDSGPADFLISLRVNEFSMRGAVKSSAETTLLYTGAISLTAVISSGSGNSEVWRSNASYSDTFESDSQEKAGDLLFRQAVRLLANKLRQAF